MAKPTITTDIDKEILVLTKGAKTIDPKLKKKVLSHFASPALIRNLHDLMTLFAHVRLDKSTFVKDIMYETDRGCILVAVAHVDKALESLLLTFFSRFSDMGQKPLQKLFDFRKKQNPLFGAFGAKSV